MTGIALKVAVMRGVDGLCKRVYNSEERSMVGYVIKECIALKRGGMMGYVKECIATEREGQGFVVRYVQDLKLHSCGEGV